MRRWLTVVTCLVTALVVATPAYAQQGIEGPSGPVDPMRSPVQVLDPAKPIPRPITAPTILFQSDEMQLVGFTRTLVTGNEGVLNMSIACQREYAGSRMCTLNEINRSVFIPERLGGGYAWVQNLANHDAQPALNCEGWMSASEENRGTSIELGECYGGMAMNACSTRQAVACCATSGPTVTR